ncbi:hypothetical protein TeGR_g343, partial [Tetraparma gracilis]
MPEKIAEPKLSEPSLEEPSLEDRAGPLGCWTLQFLNPLLKLGASKPLQISDLGSPSKVDLCDTSYTSTMKVWSDQPADKKSVAWALIDSYGRWKIVYALSLYACSAGLTFFPVLVLNQLVQYFQSMNTPVPYVLPVNVWILVVSLVALPVMITLLQSRHGVIMNHFAVHVRTSVSLMVYAKSLTISADGKAQTSTGTVVNMMSNDTTQLQRFLQFFGLVSVAPFQVGVALYLIWVQVGNSMFVGLGFLLGLAPINAFLFSFVAKYRKQILSASDSRVKLVNEVLSGIRIIKFYAWEVPFNKSIYDIREEELKALTRLAYLTAVGFSMILLSAPIILNIIVFATYISVQSDTLDAAKAFTTVALFGILRFPFAFMPMGLLQYIQSKIAIARIEKYLLLPDLPEYVKTSATPPESTPGCPLEVVVENASFQWVSAETLKMVEEEKKKPKGKRGRRGRGAEEDEKEEVGGAVIAPDADADADSVDVEEVEIPIEARDTTILHDITLSLEHGKLYGIVGEVGSGKSSLLQAILGEMEPVEPTHTVHMPRKNDDNSDGYAAYCCQTPWVINDTLRGNVLFGRAFDEKRYQEVIKVCALADDIAVLPAGDLTEIGEK